MLESFLVAGRQDLVFGQSTALSYGQSITDACIGWEETVTTLELLAEAVRKRNADVEEPTPVMWRRRC
jgi:3-deoxy-7-phosphoheptulonate synthase